MGCRICRAQNQTERYGPLFKEKVQELERYKLFPFFHSTPDPRPLNIFFICYLMLFPSEEKLNSTLLGWILHCIFIFCNASFKYKPQSF